MKLLRRVAADEGGATMVEYAILLALIAAVCIIVITVTGQTTQRQFSSFNASWN